MRKILVSLGAVSALLLTGSAARADIINFGYSASPSVNPLVKPGDDPSIIYNTNNAIKTSSIQFSPASGPASYDGTVPSQFIIYNMATKSGVIPPAVPTPSSYDAFDHSPFNLDIKLTDLTSGVQQTMKFSGTYTADHVSSTSSHVDPATQGISWTSPLSVTKQIGPTSDYTMKVISWTAPGAPGSPGSILAEVTVSPHDGGINPPPPPPPPGGSGAPPPAAPEPTSLLLAGLALPALLVARRRLKKAEAA